MAGPPTPVTSRRWARTSLVRDVARALAAARMLAGAGLAGCGGASAGSAKQRRPGDQRRPQCGGRTAAGHERRRPAALAPMGGAGRPRHPGTAARHAPAGQGTDPPPADRALEPVEPRPPRARGGRRIDDSSPIVDARLPDGSRVNAIIPPLAIDGPHLSIRKFKRDALSGEDLLRMESLTPAMLELVQGIVRARLNVLISGGTGAGKTTLLNILSSFIPADQRIVTIEDSAELQLRQPHVVRLETRSVNIEGQGEVSQRQLLINSLRMRPDRIIIGEVRGPEAIDMLQAMNTGHDGSLTTLHANGPRDALGRLETMVSMANLHLPEKAVRQQIAGAIDVVIQVSRLSDGARKVITIAELVGMEGDVITMQDIFSFERRGIDAEGHVVGMFRPTGIRPRFAERLQSWGIELPADPFSPLAALPGEDGGRWEPNRP